MIRLRKTFGLLLFALLLSSCSRVQLAYHQLDWLLPLYFESYMELSEQQEIYVQQQVDKLLSWHCGTQLDIYTEFLRDANEQIQNDRMERANLGEYADRIESFWGGILQHIGPTVSQVLLTSTDEQLDELFAGFEVRNKEWLVEFRKTMDEDLRRGYSKRLSKELERWFGRLQEGQIEVVEDWSRSFQPLGEVGLRERQRWQATLRESIVLRDNECQFHMAVQKVFSDRHSDRSKAYQAKLNHNRGITIDVIYKVLQQLSDRQKQHLDKQVTSIARDFDKLSCDAERDSVLALEASL